MNFESLVRIKRIIPEDFAMDFIRYMRWSSGVYCPRCKSFEVYKRGRQNEVQRYFCKSCQKGFNDFTGTKFSRCRIPINIVFYIMMNLDKKTYKQISDDIGYSRHAVYRISKIFKNEIYDKKEEIEVNSCIEDEELMIFDESLKLLGN
nr:transposase [Methanobrevibacter arboriphilus]